MRKLAMEIEDNRKFASKWLVSKWLESYQQLFNQTAKEEDQIRSIKLTSEMKPDNYFIPQIWIGAGLPNDESIPAWFVEIWINDLCVFRESKVANHGQDTNWKIIEESCLDRLLQNILSHGLTAAYKVSKEIQDGKFKS